MTGRTQPSLSQRWVYRRKADEIFNLEKVRQDLLSSLDERFQFLTWRHLPLIAEQVEKELCISILESIKEYFSTMVTGVQVLAGSYIVLDDEIYELTVNYGVAENRTHLVILLSHTHSQAFSPADLLVEIPGNPCGQCTHVVVMLPGSISAHLVPIARLATEIVATSYRWLEEYLLKVEKKVNTDVGKALYGYIRQIFATRPDLAETIWLTVVDQDRGFYALDAERVRSAIKILAEKREHEFRVPAQSIAIFLTTMLPFEEMHSKFVIAQDRTVLLDLRKSLYLDRKPEFETSEEALFGSRYILAYPLHREGRRFLVASFPANQSEDIVRVLADHRDEIARRFKSRGRDVQRFWKSLYSGEASDSFFRKIGQVLGGFFDAPSMQR